jgi:hypothetical protein
MKIINSKLHGILDYLIGFSLLIPWITGYLTDSRDSLITGLAGSILLIYSVSTDYEFGWIRIIPMRLHLLLDLVLGLLLIIYPLVMNTREFLLSWPMFTGIALAVMPFFSSHRAFIVTRRDTNIIRQ